MEGGGAYGPAKRTKHSARLADLERAEASPRAPGGAQAVTAGVNVAWVQAIQLTGAVAGLPWGQLGERVENAQHIAREGEGGDESD